MDEDENIVVRATLTDVKYSRKDGGYTVVLDVPEADKAQLAKLMQMMDRAFHVAFVPIPTSAFLEEENQESD